MRLRPTTKQLSIIGLITLSGLWTFWLGLGSDGYKGTLKFLKFGDVQNSTGSDDDVLSWRDRYFQQVFTESNQTSDIITPNLAELCQRTIWRPNLYLNCTDIAAGLFNQVNEIKNCIRMAIDVGANFILPSINERDSKVLWNFHQHDIAWRRQFREEWEEEHIVTHLGNACPQMKTYLSDEPPIANAQLVGIDVHKSPGFREYLGHFDRTRTFRDFVDKTLGEQNITVNSTGSPIVLQIPYTFLVINPENDPTGLDWKVWTEISLLLRATASQRRLIQTLSEAESLKKESYIGVHLRVESDAVGKWWDDFEMQAAKNLNSIDIVAKRFREKYGKDPFIYVACGDKNGIKKFKQLASLRGYTVVDKWGILANDTESLSQIDKLSFDAKGLLDYAILLNSYFFLGTLGSSFSFTVANMRSELGRYPGSSFVVGDAGKSLSHLFMPPSKRAHYACCL